MTVALIAALALLVAWMSIRHVESRSRIADLERRIASLKRQLSRETRA